MSAYDDTRTCNTYIDMSHSRHSLCVSRHFCCVTQRICLPCHAVGMSAVSHSRHICCATQPTCRMCETTVFAVTLQTFLPRETDDMSAVSPSTHVCLVRQKTMSSVRHSRYCLGQEAALCTRQHKKKYIHICTCTYGCICTYIFPKQALA